MKLCIDSHVHIHPCFDPVRAVTCLMKRLCCKGASGVALLAERDGERLLETWLRAAPDGIESKPCGDSQCLCIHGAGGERLFLVPGRQVVTSDGLEVLALCCDTIPPLERVPIIETLAWARGEDALPVIPWGLGKWTGSRGRRLRALLELAAPGDFLLGDSTMRPPCCPGTGLLNLARARGIAVLPGSDALPVPGEESVGGTYCGLIDAPGILTDPVRELHDLLAGGAELSSGGRRSGWPTVLRRQLAYKCSAGRRG